MSESTMTKPTCTLDRDIINKKTLGKMDDLGLSVFAKLCGANRGAFVLDPPDGKTYGCLAFPEAFSTNAGVTKVKPIPDSAHVMQAYAAKNITAASVVGIVDAYVGAVYSSSADVDSNPYACDVNGLATLTGCKAGANKKSLRSDGGIVKSVTLAGAFVPESWATGGKVLSMDEVRDFYASTEFRQMAALGVNTVQIPVPCDAFVDVDGEVARTVAKLLERANKAGLSAILVLVAPEDGDMAEEVVEEHIKSAATFAVESANVIALQLPSDEPSLLGAVRSEASELPVLVPTAKGEMENFAFPTDQNVFAALDVTATDSGNVANVASSDSEGDRMKMFYHESITCIDRSPIEWLDCYRDTPVFVTSGFNLAVDDCANKDSEDFKDYGQCDRFDETVGSGWWGRHRTSLASRQLFAYSQGLGWSFSAWKLYDGGNNGASDKDLSLDAPAKLLSLSDVAAAGLMPSLDVTSDAVTLGAACLNGPAADFIMGDATFAPTPAPHDCGDGWWNPATEVCDYWVPPPPEPVKTDYKTLTKGAVGGAVAALVLMWAVKKVTGRGEGYQALP